MRHTRTHVWGAAGSVLDVQVSERCGTHAGPWEAPQAHVLALGHPHAETAPRAQALGEHAPHRAQTMRGRPRPRALTWEESVFLWTFL